MFNKILKIIKKISKKKEIIIPIAVVLIGALAVFAISVLKESPDEEPYPGPGPDNGNEQHADAVPQGNLLEGCKRLNYPADKDYNFLGAIDFIIEKPAAKFLEIKKDKQLVSLGKYYLPIEPNTVLRISKLWLYFLSNQLSEREDRLYGLEDSYLSKIILKVGDDSKEIKLGKSGEHSFIELDNCPFGNIYPVEYKTYLDFEIMLEIECNNVENGECLDNKGEGLSYINGADLTAQIRLFATSFQDFMKDISISTEFRYK